MSVCVCVVCMSVSIVYFTDSSMTPFLAHLHILFYAQTNTHMHTSMHLCIRTLYTHVHTHSSMWRTALAYKHWTTVEDSTSTQYPMSATLIFARIRECLIAVYSSGWTETKQHSRMATWPQPHTHTHTHTHTQHMRLLAITDTYFVKIILIFIPM